MVVLLTMKNSVVEMFYVYNLQLWLNEDFISSKDDYLEIKFSYRN